MRDRQIIRAVQKYMVLDTAFMTPIEQDSTPEKLYLLYTVAYTNQLWSCTLCNNMTKRIKCYWQKVSFTNNTMFP